MSKQTMNMAGNRNPHRKKRRKLRSEAVMVLTLLSLLVFILTAMTLSLILRASPAEGAAIHITSTPNNGKVIVVDPGHGGYDAGGSVEEIYEKDLTLNIGLQLGELLKSRGYTVVYTREKDEALGDYEEADLAARVDIAVQQQADLMISLHTNFADEELEERCYGYEIYVNPENPFALHTAEQIDTSLQKLKYTLSRGVKSGMIYQIVEDNPQSAILIELGFLDDDTDRAYLSASQGQENIAKALADAIDASFGFQNK